MSEFPFPNAFYLSLPQTQNSTPIEKRKVIFLKVWQGNLSQKIKNKVKVPIGLDFGG